jgi:hypothetical protein
MARHAQDREDLLAEATALVERAELATGPDEHVVVGFRANGAGSLFFGGEPVYHFNPADELRRTYQAGELIKAERGRLVALARRRTTTEVQLLRRELDATETEQLLRELSDRIAQLAATLNSGQFALVGQVPSGADVLGRACAWLSKFAGCITIAPSARLS